MSQLASERSLCWAWYLQARLPVPLKTVVGEPIVLHYRGRWQAGAGPDFRDALLAIGSRPLCRGDVELHNRSADWYAHGHHRNAAYDRVVLHVVRQADGLSSRRSDGTEVPIVEVGPLAQASLAFRAASRPARKVCLPDDRCQVQALDPAAIGRALDRAGDERLTDKAARLEGNLACHPPDQILYAAVLEGLGYSQNQAPFRELASRLSWGEVQGIARALPMAGRLSALEAVLLGLAGLLPSQRRLGVPLTGEDASYVSELEEHWRVWGRPWSGWRLEATAWSAAGVRPPNWPTRRLAAAARLIARCQDGGGPVATWLNRLALPPSPSQLAAAFEVAGDGYWAARFDFGRALPRGPGQLLGHSRAADLAVNAVLPFALALANRAGLAGLAGWAWRLYAAWPRLAENEVTRSMAEQLGPAGGPKVVFNARRHQGLLQLRSRYCLARRCEECPLFPGLSTG